MVLDISIGFLISFFTSLNALFLGIKIDVSFACSFQSVFGIEGLKFFVVSAYVFLEFLEYIDSTRFLSCRRREDLDSQYLLLI